MIGSSGPALIGVIIQRFLLRTEELWRSFDLIWKPMGNHRVRVRVMFRVRIRARVRVRGRVRVRLGLG